MAQSDLDLAPPPTRRPGRSWLVLLLVAGLVGALVGVVALWPPAGDLARRGSAQVAQRVARQVVTELGTLVLRPPTPQPSPTPDKQSTGLFVPRPTPTPSGPTLTPAPVMVLPPPQGLQAPDLTAARAVVVGYLEALNAGDVAAALQAWAPEAQETAQALIAAARARQERYQVQAVQAEPHPVSRYLARVVVTLTVTVSVSGQTFPDLRHVYQLRALADRWVITARLQ